MALLLIGGAGPEGKPEFIFSGPMVAGFGLD